jgi:hypothetical protein
VFQKTLSGKLLIFKKILRKPGLMKASMADVERSLKGIDFPKSKNEIVSYA